MQVNSFAASFETVAIGLMQNHTTACGHDAIGALGQVINHFLFDSTKSRFTLALKKLPDRAAQALLYHEVRVKKLQVQLSGQLPADR